MRFTDFEHKGTGRDATLFRICIDKHRGAVAKGNYMVIEAPFAPGDEVEFVGTIRYFATNRKEADHICDMVRLGLCWTPMFGAERTVGFGRLAAVVIEEPYKATRLGDRTPQATGEHERLARVAFDSRAFDIIIKPDAPFCFARRRVSGNLFESECVIPGAALKGCLASTWLDMLGKDGEAIKADTDSIRSKLCANFDKLRFTHAFPAAAGSRQRAVAPPYSLVKCPVPTLFDVALYDKAGLIAHQPKAPMFFMDWKERGDVKARFGWVDPPTKIVVRTAIEQNRAKEQQLFAYEMIKPKGYEWLARVDLSRIADADREATARQLIDLLATGLHGFGKTTTAHVEVFDINTITPFVRSHLEPIENHQWIVTLQTPALLTDPRPLNETSGEKELRQAYQATWDKLSKGTLRLVRYFAGQTLAGGEYLYKRFQAGKAYNPYLLTEAGSVFVLEAVVGKEDDAAKCIKQWFGQGLPLPDWAVDLYGRKSKGASDKDGAQWMNCPYIPENGYGEIAVNLGVHQELNPKGAFHVI